MILPILLTLSAMTFGPQDAPVTVGQRLLADPVIRTALDRLKRAEPQIIDEQVRFCEIPAPPFKEAARAEAYKQAFQAPRPRERPDRPRRQCPWGTPGPSAEAAPGL